MKLHRNLWCILGRVLWRVIGCLAILSAPLAHAAGLRLWGDETMIPLEQVVTICEDKSASMTIDQAVRLGRFVPSPERLNLRPGHTTIWMKLELTNTSSTALARWLEVKPARLREVSLYQWRDGRWTAMEAGSNRPFAERPLAATASLFPLSLAPHEETTIYLRISSPLPIAIAPTLWEPQAFRKVELRGHLIDGLLLGSLALMAVFGILLLAMFQERAFLFNALATATYFFGEASAKGYTFMYLWPNATEWALRGLPLYATLGVGLNLLFLRSLLRTRSNFPRIDRVLLVLLACEWSLAPGILWGDYAYWAGISFPLHFPVTVVMVLVGIYAMSQGIRAARYYVAAYTVLALGSLLFGLPPDSFDIPPLVRSYALPMGMLLNNLLLMLSAVEQMLDVRREKEAAQNALLAAHATHEAHLEKAVEERTTDLNQALTETRVLNDSQTKLLAYVGHDLRAPLATIVNYVALIGDRGDPDIQRYKSTIERSAWHQLELIDDLVEYARGRLEQLELAPTACYFHDWLDDICKQAELLAGHHNNRFVLDAANAPAVAVFDPKRLRQVLVNLIGNAAKFTKNGAIRLHVHASTISDTEVALHFAVEDTGAGIPAYDLERIFLPFERRKTDQAGSGLGLTIARQLVQAMGGELTATSTPDVGSCFKFSIKTRIASETEVAQPTPVFSFPEPFGSGKSLLIADDNPASREYMKEVLNSVDFEVVCVEDGEQALQQALERPFSAVIVDQFMPGLTGWEFLRHLREAQGDDKLPVVLCSAVHPQRPTDFPAGMAFAATLLKPVAPNKLLRLVQELIDEPQPQPQDATVAPPEIFAPLRDLIAAGAISDIEDWADALEARHPELAETAQRIRDAAIRIDFAELTALAKDVATNLE
ncbi:MAG TPA: 7TM diverse intracellular signaling domain-containing protein [Rhodocyclaceae bacterium]|nr:7TM diverse intracellular signaling domain-containing protein [Rhodocyclaceae bacterium]